MKNTLSILGASSLVFPVADPGQGLEKEFEAHWSGRFRKIGRFIKLALAGAAVAVKHAGLKELPARRTGIFLGTGLGNLADLVPFVISLYDGSIPSPIQFANSVGNSGAFYVAQAYGVEGPVQAISQDEVSFEAAVVNAALLLEAGEIDLALVGGVDVFVAPLSDHLARIGRDAAELSEASLAEGAGFWVLSRKRSGSIAELIDASLSHAPAGRFLPPITGGSRLRLTTRQSIGWLGALTPVCAGAVAAVRGVEPAARWLASASPRASRGE